MLADHPLLLVRFDGKRSFAAPSAGSAAGVAELVLGAASSCAVAVGAGSQLLLPAPVPAARSVELQLIFKSMLLQR